MSDEPRPRPLYGEYATPEEQRARIRVPDASASLSAGEAPQPTRPAPAPARPAATAATPAQRLTVDRVVTIALLGVGLFNVVTGIPAYLDYATFADRVLQSAGVDAVFTNLEQGRMWGLIAAFAMGGLWFVTAALSVLRLRRERPAFWIPLVGAVVAAIVIGICLSVPLLGDPGVVDALLAGSASAPATPSPSP